MWLAFGVTKATNPKDAVGSNKPPLSTIPPAVLVEIGLALFEGHLKYGGSNWRAMGVRATVYYDACMRHLLSWLGGEDVDPDSGMPHITKAIAGLCILRDAEMNDCLTDDRPPSQEADWMVVAKKQAAEIVRRYGATAKPAFTTANYAEWPKMIEAYAVRSPKPPMADAAAFDCRRKGDRRKEKRRKGHDPLACTVDRRRYIDNGFTDVDHERRTGRDRREAEKFSNCIGPIGVDLVAMAEMRKSPSTPEEEQRMVGRLSRNNLAFEDEMAMTKSEVNAKLDSGPMDRATVRAGDVFASYNQTRGLLGDSRLTIESVDRGEDHQILEVRATLACPGRTTELKTYTPVRWVNTMWLLLKRGG